MFDITQLHEAFKQSLSVVNFQGGFDSFKFRKGFEQEFNLSSEEKNEILDYVEQKLTSAPFQTVFQTVKSQIDDQEFLTTDYYANSYPHKFRGAYAPVVFKTFAGVMALSL